VLANIRHVPTPVIADFDSSEPAETFPILGSSRVLALGSVAVLTLVCLAILVRRIIH
jgi:hypothetical protein